MNETVRFSLSAIDSFCRTAENIARKLSTLADQINGDKYRIDEFLDKNIENGMQYLEVAQEEYKAAVEASEICEKKQDNVDRMIYEIDGRIAELAREKAKAYDELERAKSAQTKAHNS